MNYMSKLAAQYSDSLIGDINEELFDRRKGKQIYEFIIDDLRSIEMLPNIHVQDIEYITDTSEIDVRLNRNNIKSKKIIRQKIEKLIPIQYTAFDALKFTININGKYKKHKVENLILIPKYIDRYHFMVNGNKTLVMFQVIDNSTYNKKGDIILKTRVPAKLSKDKRKKTTLTDVTTNKVFKVENIMIDLFRKKFIPLYYYAAKFGGILEVIKYFGYEKFMNVVAEPHNTDLFYYFKINSNIMFEVEKQLFDVDNFFKIFVGMLSNLFNARTRMQDIYDKEVWVKRLGTLFTSSTKNQLNKGYDVLKSFKNTLDATTQNILRVDDVDKVDTYAVIRWMMREFNMLRNADNNDLKNRRIRTNEYIAQYFGNIIKDKINYALNMRPYDEDKLAKILKFDEYALFKSLFGGSKACPLFRYNLDINDLQSFNGLKFSVTGIQGLPSNRIKDEQRDLYPSHLGRFELNAISPSAPGVSGMLTPFCKIYGQGYFTEDSPESKGRYRKKLKRYIKDIKESNEARYLSIKSHFRLIELGHAKNKWINRYADYRNEDGYINIVRPQYNRNENGYIKVQPYIKYVPYVRDDKGYIKIYRNNNNRVRIVRKPQPIKIVPKVRH